MVVSGQSFALNLLPVKEPVVFASVQIRYI